MHDAVRQAWRAFNAPLEGVVAWMYLDTEGHVTTGMGNEIDSADQAARLPWQRTPDGPGPAACLGPAAAAEIIAEWHRIKDATWLAQAGAQAAARIARLRLSDPSIEALIEQTLNELDARLSVFFMPAKWAVWPADAQLATLSMAWAMGSDFPHRYPRWTVAADSQDWARCARECAIATPANAAVSQRNAANRQCFSNAAEAVLQGLASVPGLWWPSALVPSAAGPSRR